MGVRAVLTVVGKDNVGIIAGVSKKLAELNINIEDVSQTIMDGYFTMMMMCEISQITKEFDEVKAELAEKGEELQVKIHIQREEIFNAMHKL
nr:ACT domain-containing protein [Listeria immobilis]